jgi:hypothetical protein
MAGMTVGKLIEVLQGLPQDALVVLAKDSEGNDYSPIPGDPDYAYCLGTYIPESTWHGEFHWPDPTEETEAEDGDEEEDDEGDEDEYEPDPDAVVAVCLWPTN